MHSLLLVLILAAEPAPALSSLSGLNVKALKPWLLEQLPSLAQCVLPKVSEGDDLVTVQAQFAKAPEVSVLKVESAVSDVACVRGVVERWRRDSKQPSAGSFSFKYRFRPNEAQRAAVAAQAQRAFATMCEALPRVLTRDSVRAAVKDLPVGAQVVLEDAVLDTESLAADKVSVALSRALRDVAATFKADQCIRP
ncbi:MAG: hypothetical protein Q8K32_32585 [Archangium sp.]|nr:hypothetical protein [Archangium sp.]